MGNVYLLRCWLGQESAARISQTISWQTSEMDPDTRGGPDDRPCRRFRSHQTGVDFSLLFRPSLRAAATKLIVTGLGIWGQGHAVSATHSRCRSPYHTVARAARSAQAIERKLTRN